VNEVLQAAMTLLPDNPFEEARYHLDHGEYGLALDTIAATLAQAGKRATPGLCASFVSLGRHMGFEGSNWMAIRPLTQ